MTASRYLAAGVILALALVITATAAACGGGGERDGAEQAQPTTPAASSDLQVAITQVNAMVSGAKAGDLDAAAAAFEEGHDPLHAVIDELEAGDPELAAKLDEAVDDAEKDLEEGADADHIVEIGNEILDLLAQIE